MHTHLNRANYFADNSNYYNAIREYADAIKVEKQTILGHGNVAGVYDELGLQQIAMQQISQSISKIESGLKEKDVSDFMLYSLRARLEGNHGMFDLMLKDIDQCKRLKKVLHYRSVCTMTQYLLRTNQLNELELFIKDTMKEFEELDSLNYFIHADLPDFKMNFHAFLSLVFEALNNYQRAILEINSAIKINDKIIRYHYHLGQLLYKSNDIQKAENIYSAVKKKNWKFIPYKLKQFQDGIIVSINPDNKSGKLITSTFFNPWDIIDFENDETNTKLIPGDLVSIKLEYIKLNNVVKGVTSNIKKVTNIYTYKLKQNNTFHCLVNNSQNLYQKTEPVNFVYAFYPAEFLFPFSFIQSYFTMTLTEELEAKGYLFLEIDFIVNNRQVKINSLKALERKNMFSDIIIPSRRRQNISNKKSDCYSDKKECSVCQMEEWCGTDGCPLDPT